MPHWLPLLGVIARRLRSRATLLLGLWAGLTLVVALVVSIPVYAEWASNRLLQRAVDRTADYASTPPFSTVYDYSGDGRLTAAAFRQIDAVVTPAGARAGLPVLHAARHAATDKLRLLPPRGAGREVLWARLAFVAPFEQQIRLLEGRFPAPAAGPGRPIEVLVAEAAANAYALLIDDVYRLRSPAGQSPAFDLQVKVVGVWQPLDERGDGWFYPPAAFDEVLIVPEESFMAAVEASPAPWITTATWYSVLDGSAVQSAHAAGLGRQIQGATAAVQQAAPGVRLSTSPLPALIRQQQQVRVLTLNLALFSLPLFGVLGFFLVQSAGLIVQRQEREIAALRSRGCSRTQVLLLALGEAIAIGLLAVLAGVPFSLLLAQLIAWTDSFLRFAPTPGPPVALLAASWWHAGVAALALPAVLVPAIQASRHTIISFKQQRSRLDRRPWWERAYLDLLLLIPALYGYQQLKLGGVFGPDDLQAPGFDPLRNPVLIAAPALFVFALTLFGLRCIPRLLALAAALSARIPGVVPVLALRTLARTRAHDGLVLLVALTLSLGAFTASMARTLDDFAYDRARYSAGPDVVLTDLGEAIEAEVPAAGAGPSEPAAPAPYLFAPVEEFLTLPGVQEVARVGRSDGFVIESGTPTKALFLGVDPYSLPTVLGGGWRSDYAAESLGALMNRLASEPAAVLVSRPYAAAQGLGIGDRVVLRLSNLGTSVDTPFAIAGVVDYFPTLYREVGPYFIGNLDYSFEAQGGLYPYQVWMKTEPNSRPYDIQIASVARGWHTRLHQSPELVLADDLGRPERQGVFGLLSLGFLAASTVTILGVLAYTALAFQRRLVELGALRATGLSTRQLLGVLVWEQVLIIGIGTLLGTGLGVIASRLFMPFFRVRSESFPDTPPFLPKIAWEQIGLIYGVATGLLLLSVAVTVVLLRRTRLFEVMKLGESL